MKVTIFLASLFQAVMAGYGVHSQNYALTTFSLAMVFLHCADEIVKALKDKNAN